MAEDLSPSQRRPTGIPGLDRILEGGLLVSGVYIVQGPPGAGKTILANQACFHHASTGGARRLRDAAGRIAFPHVCALAADGVL